MKYHVRLFVTKYEIENIELKLNYHLFELAFKFKLISSALFCEW